MHIDRYRRPHPDGTDAPFWEIPPDESSDCDEFTDVVDALWSHHFPPEYCSCGSTEDMLEYVASLLRRMENRTIAQRENRAHDPSDEFDYEDWPGMFALYVLDTLGLTEHGVSVRCSWLTDKGRELMEDVEELKAKR